MTSLRHAKVGYIGVSTTGFKLVVVAVFILLAAWAGIESLPRLTWDEGWTLNVARNWAVDDFYGQYQSGELHGSGLSAAFPVVAPVALSFRLFGVGIWQGRLPFVLFTFIYTGLVYLLSYRLYARPVAIGALALLLLLPLSDQFHPLLFGRMALGEVPALVYLLGGYACLLEGFKGKRWYLLGAAVLWGLAVQTKAQVLPFWLAAQVFAGLYALWRRQWRLLTLLAVTVLGAWVCSRGIGMGVTAILAGRSIPNAPIPGLRAVTAYVIDAEVRLRALFLALTFGLMPAIGMIYSFWRELHAGVSPGENFETKLVRIGLIGLAGSWFAWYLLLSVAWTRYLLPSIYLGIIFAAYMLFELTSQADFISTLRRAASLLRSSRREAGAVPAMTAILLLAMYLGICLIALRSFSPESITDAELPKVAAYLNENSAEDSVIESYDPQLFFILERAYHFPPEDLHVNLNRKAFIDSEASAPYDALIADPDILIVGPSGNEWQLYEDVLTTGEFELDRQFSKYQIYRRIR